MHAEVLDELSSFLERLSFRATSPLAQSGVS
jgi:hypothetical protein